MIILILAGVIGVGVALFFNGRSTGSLFKKATGVTFALLGFCLLALMFMVEAKKADII